MPVKRIWAIVCRLCGKRTFKYRKIEDETGMNVEYYCNECFAKAIPSKYGGHPNLSVDSSNCQPSEGEPVAKAGDASPEPDGSVGGRRSESEGVRDESPKDSSGGSPTTVKAGCKDSRREGGKVD